MDDDRLIGSMVTALAQPRTPPPDALDQIAAASVRAHRRRRLVRGVAVAAAAVVAAALVVSVPRLADRGPTSTNGGRAFLMSARVHGFYLETVLTYPTAGRILSGVFIVDGSSYPARFYTDSNDDVTFPALDIDAGERAYLSGSVIPICEGTPSPPVGVVEFRLPDGDTSTQRVSADAASQQRYATEREWWCSVPAHAAITESGHDGRGNADFRLDVDNTTSHAITVTSGHLRYGETNWAAASVTVPPRSRASLAVHATGYHGGPKPWDHGLLTADGVPITPPRY